MFKDFNISDFFSEILFILRLREEYIAILRRRKKSDDNRSNHQNFFLFPSDFRALNNPC